MFDFRLQVFTTVAKRLNFTKAAAELYISQPAVTKHIRELESQFKITLFERSGNKKIILTTAGQLLLQHAEQLMAGYQSLEYDMHQLQQEFKGIIRIGASTTVAQYVIPQVLAQFHQKFRDVKVTLLTANTEQIEQALLNKEIDLGIVEGMLRNPQIKYQEYLQDEIVLVTSSLNKFKKQVISPEDLLQHPILLREPGSGTLEVIAHALKAHQIKLADLNIEMQLGSTESIKAYLLQGTCLAFLSIHAVLKELKNRECRIIDVKGLQIGRPFYFVQPYGQSAPLVETFMRYASTYRI